MSLSGIELWSFAMYGSPRKVAFPSIFIFPPRVTYRLLKKLLGKLRDWEQPCRIIMDKVPIYSPVLALLKREGIAHRMWNIGTTTSLNTPPKN